ncbi:MAG: hypothetical protein CML66_11235 [Rhodobacteraceae bacterium]|nr:hypothetical protein [Paracoccaceae bacterium]MAY46678.1 hypothetical protein [Paracoccaceae bacterium]QEW20554.1 hypothetical protein LA6_002753 [Marinibacterium anthonyi]
MTKRHTPEPPRKAGLLFRLRSSFLTGIVVITPVALTIWLIFAVVTWVDKVVLPFVPDKLLPQNLINVNFFGVGVVIFLVFTIVVGWIAKGLIGRSLIRQAENIVDRMPVVRTIYNGIKQISETVFAQSERSFEKAVLVEYPRRGIWAIGFISTHAKGEILRRAGNGEKIMSVFVPTTPNPTSGFLLYFPADDVIELDMSVEEAAKLVISAGLVYPSEKPDDDDVANLLNRRQRIREHA